MIAPSINPELLNVHADAMEAQGDRVCMEPKAWRQYQKIYTALEESPKVCQASLDTMLQRGRDHGKDRYHEGMQDGAEGMRPWWHSIAWGGAGVGFGVLIGAVLGVAR